MIRDLDIIGVILTITDDSDPENPVTEPSPGWHVNLPESEMQPGWEPWRVTPEEPLRAIWGAATARLRFEDENEARAVLGLDETEEGDG